MRSGSESSSDSRREIPDVPRPQDQYDQLDDREIEGIRNQIDMGMRTTNGDTAPVDITARQAMILLDAYELVKTVHPNWDHRYSVGITREQYEQVKDILSHED